MDVFWSRRYHAAALPDLVPTMKLSRGSLYAAFGDKHSLFLRALDRSVADALTRMDIELDPRRAPVDGLRAFLSGYVDRASGANGRLGCLLVATATDGVEPSRPLEFSPVSSRGCEWSVKRRGSRRKPPLTLLSTASLGRRLMDTSGISASIYRLNGL
jgi:AcrR family transcriptional regulator